MVMKKTVFFLSALLLVCFISTKVQGAGTEPYHPLLSEGKIWITDWQKTNPCQYPNCCGKNAVRIGRQASIGKSTYYEVESNEDWPDFPEDSWVKEPSLYLRESGCKVYCYSNYDGCEGEELLYDFNLPLDTVIFLGLPLLCEEKEMSAEDSLHFKYKVIAIDSVNTEQGKRKRLHLGYYAGDGKEEEWLKWNEWVEGIGNTEKGIFYTPLSSLIDCTLRQLAACYDGDQTIYQASESWPCTIGVDDIPAAQFKVYILENSIVIEGLLPGEEITVYAPSGVLLQTLMSTGDRVEISLPSKGIYLIKAAGETVKVIY